MTESDPDDAKYLPAGPTDGQVKVSAAGQIKGTDMDVGRGEHEIALYTGEGQYPIQMVLDRASDNEFVTGGVENYDSWEELFRPELDVNPYDRVLEDGTEFNFEESNQIDRKTARDVISPSYEEMDELAEKYEDQLQEATTDKEEREILAEAWEEASNMELNEVKSMGSK